MFRDSENIRRVKTAPIRCLRKEKVRSRGLAALATARAREHRADRTKFMNNIRKVMKFGVRMCGVRLLVLIGFTSHRTQNRSFRWHSSQPISWLSTEKLKQTQQKQTCIHNKIYYNIKLTPKDWNQVWSPSTTSGLETDRVYSGRSRQISQEVNK